MAQLAQRGRQALAAAHMDRDIFNNTYTPIVINTGSKLVVVDTGVGVRDVLEGARPKPHFSRRSALEQRPRSSSRQNPLTLRR